MTNPHITVNGETITATTPEGKSVSMPLEKFFALVRKPAVDLSTVIPPPGVLQRVRDNIILWIYQRPPQRYAFKWLSPESEIPYGAGAKYEVINIALPYLIVIAAFHNQNGTVLLSGYNDAYFANSPLRSNDDPLCYPALFNCSLFNEPGQPIPAKSWITWICTQHLKFSFNSEPDLNRRMNRGMTALLQCLLETGFNLSSDHHELISGYTATVKDKVDNRIATIAQWEKASAQNPLFVLDVPWLPTGLTLGGVTDHIFNLHSKQYCRPRNPLSSSDDIMGLLLKS